MGCALCSFCPWATDGQPGHLAQRTQQHRSCLEAQGLGNLSAAVQRHPASQADEVTAFAAGHRPCNFCQRARTQEFKEAWVRANIPAGEQQAATMPDIDKVLHAERAIRGGGKKSYRCALSELPPGAMFDLDDVAYAVGIDGVHAWSFAGYGPAVALDSNTMVDVLTPASVVRTFSAGFVPKAHESLKLS